VCGIYVKAVEPRAGQSAEDGAWQTPMPRLEKLPRVLAQRDIAIKP
jgi:hypothetical protein